MLARTPHPDIAPDIAETIERARQAMNLRMPAKIEMAAKVLRQVRAERESARQENLAALHADHERGERFGDVKVSDETARLDREVAAMDERITELRAALAVERERFSDEWLRGCAASAALAEEAGRAALAQLADALDVLGEIAAASSLNKLPMPAVADRSTTMQAHVRAIRAALGR